LKRATHVEIPLVTLDRRRPLLQQIIEALRAAIDAGRLRSNDRVPSTRAVARALGVSRQLVVSAYEELIATGYLRGRVGDGSYVAWTEPPFWIRGSARVIVDPDGHAIRLWAGC
jgi:GntR family transcriptional regulator / MocR family aminotransferase